MLQYMLDTDICIHVLKRHPPALLGHFNRMTGALCVSSVSMGELYFGAEKSTRRTENIERLVQFELRLAVLPFTIAAAAHFGAIRAELEAVGRTVGAYDMLIGGHARSEGLTVVTNNEREFVRMPGVPVESWL